MLPRESRIRLVMLQTLLPLIVFMSINLVSWSTQHGNATRDEESAIGPI